MTRIRILLVTGFFLVFVFSNCKRENSKLNRVNALLEPYCPTGPNSCKDTLINVEGYLDKNNISMKRFFLLPDINKNGISLSDAFDNSFISVSYPQTNLDKYFSTPTSQGDYFIDFKAKAIIHKAKIHLFYRDNPGVDDGNYLSVDSISQIEFYKVEKNGILTRL